MEEKESFVYYLDWAKELLDYPDDLRLKIDDAVKRYVLYGEEPTDRAVLYSMFGLMRRRIDRDSNKWNSIREKRADAGRKGGKQRVANQANASLAKQIKQEQANQANQAVNVNVISSTEDKDKETIPKGISKKDELSLTPQTRTKRKKKVFTKPTVEEIKAYCLERGNSVDAQRFFDYYESRGWVVGKSKTPMKDWQAAVRLWEQDESKDRHAETSLGPGEWVENGVRYYGSGREVPMSAPPRPNTGSYWSGETNSWICGV